MADTVRTFEEAAKGLEGEEALQAMGNAYANVILERPEQLMMQMQMYLAVAAAEQEGDRQFGEAVRAGWERLWDSVHLRLGADVEETTVFMAFGMLINCLVAMGFPPEHRVWQGIYLSARPGGRLGDISATIGRVARTAGYGIPDGFGGHGIGRRMHEDPAVPNDGRPRRGMRLVPGMVLTALPER